MDTENGIFAFGFHFRCASNETEFDVILKKHPVDIVNIKVPETSVAEFANRVDLDEPPHLDLLCLPSSLWILNMI